MPVGFGVGHSIGHFLSSHLHLEMDKVPTLLAQIAAFTAFFGSCCALPLFLMLTGVGSMAFAITMVPYRPYFLLATLLMLGVAFYLVYGRKPSCTAGICSPKKIRRTKAMLWVSTTFVFIFLVGPYLYEILRPQ